MQIESSTYVIVKKTFELSVLNNRSHFFNDMYIKTLQHTYLYNCLL